MARTLLALRRAGFTAAVVERWIPHTTHRRDLFGVADVLGVHPTRREFLLVQCTTAGHVAHRLAKARESPELAAWLRAGGQFEVWGWVNRAGRWQVRRVALSAGDLAAVPVTAIPRRRGRRPQQPELFPP